MLAIIFLHVSLTVPQYNCLKLLLYSNESMASIKFKRNRNLQKVQRKQFYIEKSYF